MDKLNGAVEAFVLAAWGLPLLILLIGGGLYLLILSRFLPFRFFFGIENLAIGKFKDSSIKEDFIIKY